MVTDESNLRLLELSTVRELLTKAVQRQAHSFCHIRLSETGLFQVHLQQESVCHIHASFCTEHYFVLFYHYAYNSKFVLLRQQFLFYFRKNIFKPVIVVV